MRTNLREARKALRLSQAALAIRLGITKAYVSQIELKQRTPPVDLALAIARELNRSVEELFSVDELNETTKKAC